MKTFRLISTLFVFVWLAACGSSDDELGITPATTSTTLTPVSGNGASHIGDGNGGATGTIDGVVYNYTGLIRVTSASSRISIQVENHDDSSESWNVFFLKPEVGTYACDDPTKSQSTVPLLLALDRNSSPTGSNTLDGSCTITITVANDDQLEGHFEALLTDPNDDTGATKHNVADGFFRVVYADVAPDADGDGVFDDDDNCPNDANPGQEDVDNDQIGDVCDPDFGGGDGGGGDGGGDGGSGCDPQNDPASLPSCGPEDLDQLCAAPGLDVLIDVLQPGTCAGGEAPAPAPSGCNETDPATYPVCFEACSSGDESCPLPTGGGGAPEAPGGGDPSMCSASGPDDVSPDNFANCFAACVPAPGEFCPFPP